MEILKGTIEEAFNLYLQIPEFTDGYTWEVFEERIKGKDAVILIAYDGEAIGFKVGYGIEDKFYSWMGGVLPVYRRKGVAKALAVKQEELVKGKYNKVLLKTRNEHKNMLLFSISNGFKVVKVEGRDIFLEKDL